MVVGLYEAWGVQRLELEEPVKDEPRDKAIESLRQAIPAERVEDLRSCISPILEVMQTLFDMEPIEPFRLEFQSPVLSRKAAILPVDNPSNEITRIRRRATQLLEDNKELHEKLLRGGLNVPGIVHSTIMRLKKAPSNVPRFVAGFDAIAAATAPFAMTATEILLTTETKPYMREGQIVHRFALAGPQHGV